jgi:hypothetical protein
MTNRLAIVLGAVIIGAITWDILRNDTAATVFMAQKVSNLSNTSLFGANLCS